MQTFFKYQLAQVSVVLFVGTLGYVGGHVAHRPAVAQSAATYDALARFAEVLGEVQNRYVEHVDDDLVIDAAIRGMLAELDPHSVYMDPEAYAAMRADTRGEYVGVGIMISADVGGVRVQEVFEGGPARDAGVLVGDLIVGVDGDPTVDLEVDDMVGRLRGRRGEAVTVSLLRLVEEESTEVDVTIVRDTIHVAAVSEELVLPDYGVARIRSFQAGVSDDLRGAIDRLQSENDGPLDGLVLDLRGNPGGLLAEAITVSDVFLSSGEIVSTRGAHVRDESWSASRAPTRYRGPLVVLVDGGTASASEIVAGALQDQGRAVVIGTQTYGKGSVQSVLDLADGSGLKLTISLYYTPLGRSIQGEGIHPDFIVAAAGHGAEVETAADAEPHGESALEGALENPDAAPDQAGFDVSGIDDPQLRAALEQLHAFAVFSGE